MTFRQTARKIREPAKEHKKTLIVLLLRWVFLAMLAPTFSLMIKNIITSLEKRDIDSFLVSVSIIWFLMFINVTTTYFIRRNNTKFRTGIQNTLYQRYLWMYLWRENTFAERLWTGQINNIFQKWCDNRTSLLAGFPLEGFSYFLRLILVLFIMAYYLWWKGFVIVFLLFFISFSIAQRWNKQTWPLKKKLRDFYTSADKDIVKIIMSKWEINQSQKWLLALQKIKDIFEKIMNYEQSINRLRIFSFDIQRWSIQFMQICFLLIVGYGVMNWEYEIWLIAMFWMLSNQINSSIEEINNYITNFHTQIIYIQKLRDTFDDAPRIEWYDKGNEFLFKTWNISLDNICFGYNESQDIFSNFSLKLIWWTKTALVGESGGWKSTLIKLIAGYIKPDSGEIFIDNQKLPPVKGDEGVSLQSYYRHIGYLTQDPSVFDGTIYENLIYGMTENLDQEIPKDKKESSLSFALSSVISLAKCEFIYDLPQGIHTEIGERWVRLSWGQKQRLAIAKIMLKNPNIILLDEPTSALDSFNEELVTEALNNLFKWKTVIVVAHRLQTVKNSDRILYIDGGKVFEEWNHESLIALWGRYKKMLDLQSGF